MVPGVADEHAHVVQHGGGLHEEAVVVVQRQRQLRAAVLAARAARLHPPQDLLHEQSGRFSPPVALKGLLFVVMSPRAARDDDGAQVGRRQLYAAVLAAVRQVCILAVLALWT